VSASKAIGGKPSDQSAPTKALCAAQRNPSTPSLHFAMTLKQPHKRKTTAMSEQQVLFEPVEVTDGPFAGWKTWGYGSDPYETLTGPFHMRFLEDGNVECGTIPAQEHCNGGGAIHGGFLMTFADFAIFAIAYDALDRTPAVTLSLTSEFLSAGKPGVMMTCRGEVLRRTRKMIFARGIIEQEGEPVLSFTGILKRISR
jgi:acyl-coenzyme A thioesterase 13